MRNGYVSRCTAGGSIRKKSARGEPRPPSDFDLHFAPARTQFPPTAMNDFNADGPSENEWEEQGELTWNEFDWERYLREQDDTIQRYLTHYEKLNHQAD